ncbi:MAG: Gfo/Idh/MocA family oxidoreductase [Sphingobium yanoikuyae]|uniref:Gfo/Idh/MocA family protein n=1 Tax=Sphingobium yanoikuyae TaxID=13690 RepID=UPI001B2207A9|nr:Gfo/Idh/MocA family oxidoreductase [Sphingobium yanoikuyae]
MPPAPRAIVVGTGFGCRIHVPALRAAGFEVAGLVGTDPDRTRRRADAVNIADIFTDLGEAIDRTGAVAVTIATPPATHAALALTAIERGCHILCEKPMAADLAEARAMLAAAEQAGVTHLIGNEFRWAPDRAMIGRAIASGLIGDPRYVTLSSILPIVADPAARMPRWWFDAGAGGGWLGAHGSHLVDQLRVWLGEVDSLSATLPTVSDRPTDAAEDSYIVRFRMKNGAQGVLQHSAGVWGPSENVSRVAGTHGTLWVDKGVVRIADRDGVRDLPVDADLGLPPIEADDPRKAAMLFELAPFIRLCEALRAGVEGRPMPDDVPVPTFHDGVAAMALLDAIRQSAAQDGALINMA